MEFDAGAVQALRRGGAGPEFVHHQHVLYSCDLVDTQQKMACPATIDEIYQQDGAWEYDISFTDPSDGDSGRFGVPEDKLRVDPAAPRAVNQRPAAATHVPFAGDGAKLAEGQQTARQRDMDRKKKLDAQEKRVRETAEQVQERKRKREDEEKEQRRQRRAAGAVAKQAPAARQAPTAA